MQQGTRWTGAQVGPGKAEESKVAPGPTVKQTLPQEHAPLRRPHPTPHVKGTVSSFFHSPSWLRLWVQSKRPFDRATEAKNLHFPSYTTAAQLLPP